MDAEAIERRLEDAAEELRRRLADITAAPRDPAAAVSFGKRVGEGTSQAVERIAQVSTAQALDAKLRSVDRALAKLRGGTYGRCDRCGEPIGADRLEAVPWAARCRACAGSSTV